MINQSIIFSTDLFSTILCKLNLSPHIRKHNDMRLVFYHGIGMKATPCMKYLNDEITEQTFTHQLDYLTRHYTILSLKEATMLIEKNELHQGKPVCTISFDDGLKSVYTKAFPILKQKGILFDVFLNTAAVDNNQLLWLHKLNYLLSNFGATETSKAFNKYIKNNIEEAPSSAKGIETWCRQHYEYIYENKLLDSLFRHFNLNETAIAQEQQMYLTWQQVDEMSQYGAGFYSHTHQHHPLNAFSKVEHVEREITLAREIMMQHGKSGDFVSFPFGMEVDYGKANIHNALQAGHKFAVEVGEGINSRERVLEQRIMSRVELGNVSDDDGHLYSAIEMRPVIKSRLKAIKGWLR
ncbi:peptidoglycan/xylan/chitin deacetylase (PgdA/CDA1 family) [Endozoicomonas sp. NE40]|uniref:Peptidoglycan/xylan/chitin deacetylase (PgdA/CDA1 family) n=2 Tax=Endozoicomonas lisbonensis TaxID=3120522 RepID=A0ABV2SKC8_9GAMM